MVQGMGKRGTKDQRMATRHILLGAKTRLESEGSVCRWTAKSTFRVLRGIDNMKKAHIADVVDVNLNFQYNNKSLSI